MWLVFYKELPLSWLRNGQSNYENWQRKEKLVKLCLFMGDRIIFNDAILRA
jgi:hypothetical protein